MSSQRNFSKGFSRIDKTLGKVAKQYNLEPALNKYKACKYWNEVAGGFVENAKEFTKVMDFSRGVLKVACLSREIAYKIRLLADRIIEALNLVFGCTVVYAIYIET
jgi:hypothetical protein